MKLNARHSEFHMCSMNVFNCVILWDSLTFELQTEFLKVLHSIFSHISENKICCYRSCFKIYILVYCLFLLSINGHSLAYSTWPLAFKRGLKHKKLFCSLIWLFMSEKCMTAKSTCHRSLSGNYLFFLTLFSLYAICRMHSTLYKLK